MLLHYLVEGKPVSCVLIYIVSPEVMVWLIAVVML